MKTVAKRLYEGLFLLNSAEAASDWEGVNKAITTVLDRSEAEVVSTQKWDERRLAYEVNKKNRGTYILVYFRADGGKIADIERDCQLSEQIMRVLILSTESMSQDDIDKDTPAAVVEKRQIKMAEDAAKAAEIRQAEEAAKAEAAANEPVEAEAVESVEAEVTADEPVEAEAAVVEPVVEAEAAVVEPVVEAETKAAPADEAKADEPGEAKEETPEAEAKDE